LVLPVDWRNIFLTFDQTFVEDWMSKLLSAFVHFDFECSQMRLVIWGEWDVFINPNKFTNVECNFV
jgi:hypothetical protein